MTDPFVPTGRELDEGVTGPGLEKSKPARPGLLKRIFTRPQKHTGKNLTEVELIVDDEVAERLPGIRSRPPQEGADDKPPRRSRGAEAAAEPAPPPPEPVFQPGVEFIASVVALSRKPTPAVAVLCEGHLVTASSADGGADLLNWWLKADSARPPALPSLTRAAVPEDVLTVLDFVTHDVTGSRRLTTYQRTCATWDEFDRALKDLTRKARSYPSLEDLAACIKERDVEAAQQHIHYDSAAWHECRLVISEAMSALEATLKLGTRPAMVKFPRQAADMPPIHQAVISTICTPSSVASTLDDSRERLATTPVPDSDPGVQQLVSRLLRQ